MCRVLALHIAYPDLIPCIPYSSLYGALTGLIPEYICWISLSTLVLPLNTKKKCKRSQRTLNLYYFLIYLILFCLGAIPTGVYRVMMEIKYYASWGWNFWIISWDSENNFTKNNIYIGHTVIFRKRWHCSKLILLPRAVVGVVIVDLLFLN